MPVVPTFTYPVVEDVMNRARAIVNDAYQGGAGRILTDQAPFSVEFLNDALEELQDEMGDFGSITLIRDNYIMTPVTPVAAINPETQVNISFTGYFDGAVMHAEPTLPADMLVPLDLWETITGSNLPFTIMTPPQRGLYPTYQTNFLGQWEWRGDAIFMLGSTSTEDLRLRYQGRLQPITASTTQNPWSNVSVLIQASTRSLALLVAYTYARARGSQFAQVLKADAERAKRNLLNRYVLQSQGTRFERQPYQRDDYGWKIPGTA